jgi:hypothetical protein
MSGLAQIQALYGDYDRFDQHDRVSITGLYALEPGQPVAVQIRTPEDRVETIHTRHTLIREQIAWFRAGSALNAGQPVDPVTGRPADLETATLKPTDTKAKPGKDV